MITTETAIVYRAGNRRFFTKKAAIAFKARSVVNRHLDNIDCQRIHGHDKDGAPLSNWTDDMEPQYHRLIAFMVRVYTIAYRRQKDNGHGNRQEDISR